MRLCLHLLHEGFAIGDDVGIAHDLEELDLVERLLDLLIVHLGDVDNLHYELLLGLLGLHQHCVAEGAFAHYLHLPVLVHSNYNITNKWALSK
jgi:hypothetical protein